MTSRRPLSPMRRLSIFEAALGRCHLCGNVIRVGERWDVDHIRPLGLDGADDESNLGPVHKLCHSYKTKDDVGKIAKAKRMKAKHIGIKKRSTWQTKWKRKIDGTTVLR